MCMICAVDALVPVSLIQKFPDRGYQWLPVMKEDVEAADAATVSSNPRTSTPRIVGLAGDRYSLTLLEDVQGCAVTKLMSFVSVNFLSNSSSVSPCVTRNEIDAG